MRVLLMAMPDVATSFDRVMRMPNLGLASLAANVEGAEVRVLDLVLRPRAVGRAVRQALLEWQPHLVGLSAMTFQYHTAKEVAAIVRQVLPAARTVLGGYHATLAADQIAADPGAHVFDFLVRGEGEQALNLLVRALREGGDLAGVPGLSYRLTDGAFTHNPRGPDLDLADIRPPAREVRLATGFTYFGRPFDVVETSRGCTRTCRFCSIRHMYTSHRQYPLARVLADIHSCAEAGAEGVFFVDDNLNLDPARVLDLCEGIVVSRLNHLEYITQADVTGFLQAPKLPAAMRRAGFGGVFLGIESVAPGNRRFLRKGNTLEHTAGVVRSLREQGIAVAGGFIVGNPDEGAAEVRAAFHTARTLGLDHAIMWCLTPYPGTEIREELLAEGLVVNPDDYRWYNGFICNVRTRRLSHRRLVQLMAGQGLALYFHPGFLFHQRLWGHRAGSVLPYLQASLEYLTRGFRNRLYASRHRM